MGAPDVAGSQSVVRRLTTRLTTGPNHEKDDEDEDEDEDEDDGYDDDVHKISSSQGRSAPQSARGRPSAKVSSQREGTPCGAR